MIVIESRETEIEVKFDEVGGVGEELSVILERANGVNFSEEWFGLGEEDLRLF